MLTPDWLTAGAYQPEWFGRGLGRPFRFDVELRLSSLPGRAAADMLRWVFQSTDSISNSSYGMSP
jgi:hypothetical protein